MSKKFFSAETLVDGGSNALKPIGGFFDIEIRSPASGGLHRGSVALSTGRACLALALEELRPTACYVPYYCCNSLLEPIEAANIKVAFYGIDEELEPEVLPNPGSGELLIYTNFFGLKNHSAQVLSSTFKRQVLIDNTHSFFNRGYLDSYSFTSARKYFGVPDGAYLYPPEGIRPREVPERNNAVRTEHLFARLLERDDEALALFRSNEAVLGSEVLRMSAVSDRLLATVDYASVMERRTDNYDFLAERLGATNRFGVQDRGNAVPFCYPYLPDPPIPHERFYAQRIYPPRLWPDPLARQEPGFDFSRCLCRDLLPLPVDHRYDGKDMERIAAFIASERKA